MEILKMKTSQQDYNIYVGDKNILENLSSYLEKYDSILILSNSTVGTLYEEFILDKIYSLLDSTQIGDNKKNIHSFQIEDGEEFKNFQTANKVFDFMLKNSFFRNSAILTLGGGVVCDLGGFVASTYMRGIDFIQIPTSLLAQVDASIGGKVAINHGTYKNSIGAFYQPQAVFINTDFLQTLPNEEFASGMGEVIKHSLISKDENFLKFLEENSREILSLNPESLSSMIVKSCEIKKSIVERDEKEMGERAFLNLGHTYGHALESAYDFRNITHGEGVAKGIIFELTLAERFQSRLETSPQLESHSQNLLSNFLDSNSNFLSVAHIFPQIKSITLRVKNLFSLYNLDCEPVRLREENLIKHMLKDKKNSAEGIKFVIFKDFGEFSSNVVDSELILEVNKSFTKNLVKAVIDIGTNSIRLLIAEAEKETEEERVNGKASKIRRNLLELVEITQLGKGVDKNRMLLEDSMNVSLRAIKKFRDLAWEYGAVTIKGFATSAVRDAFNREDFLLRVKFLKVDVECISGKKEAELSFVANSSIFPEKKIFLLDIGGGSTEFTLGDKNSTTFQESYNVGAVRISELFFKNGEYSEWNISAARRWIREKLKPISEFKDYEFTLVGVAATVTTQATVQEKMEIYDSSKLHLYKLSRNMIKDNLELFLSLSLDERKKLSGLEPKRAEVIIGGTLILHEIMEILGSDSLTLSEVDNLEGGIILY